MAKDDPVNSAILQLRDGDLAGEGAIGLVVYILSGDANFFLRVLADEKEVECRWSNDGL